MVLKAAFCSQKDLTFGPLAEIVTGSLVQHAGDLSLHELGVLQVGHQYQVLPKKIQYTDRTLDVGSIEGRSI